MNVVLESNCLVAIQLIKACLDGGGSKDTIVKEIVRVYRQLANCDLQIVRRNCNSVTDWLVENCDKSNVDIRIIDNPCSKVRQLLLSNLSNLSNE